MSNFRFISAVDNSSRVLHVNLSGGLTLLDYNNGSYRTKHETITTYIVAACWAVASSAVLTVEVSGTGRFLRLWNSSRSNDPNEWTMFAECAYGTNVREHEGELLIPREPRSIELGLGNDSEMVA